MWVIWERRLLGNVPRFGGWHLFFMHELSIATSIVEIVREEVSAAGGGRVIAVTVRTGRLASVHESALRSAFDVAIADTPLAGAELRVVAVPVRIFCRSCAGERELPGIGSLACPACGNVSGDIRAGTELELESIEIDSSDTSPMGTATMKPVEIATP